MTGPSSPRWTHIALPSSDLDASIAWYEKFTPLRVLDRREDTDGQAAWLSHEGQVDNPFVLVLVMFWKDKGKPQPQLAPFAHIGIASPRWARRPAASRGQPVTCPHRSATSAPSPIPTAT
jgi:lactoylglutathione lyase